MRESERGQGVRERGGVGGGVHSSQHKAMRGQEENKLHYSTKRRLCLRSSNSGVFMKPHCFSQREKHRAA